MLLHAVTLARLAIRVQAEEAQNCTISIPGFTNHGNCNLLCRSSRWTDVLIFFLANYIAHAASIKGRPGQSRIPSIMDVIFALFYPTAGVLRGLRAVKSGAIFGKNELDVAARAGALLEVVEERNSSSKLRDSATRHSESDIELQNPDVNDTDKSKSVRIPGPVVRKPSDIENQIPSHSENEAGQLKPCSSIKRSTDSAVYHLGVGKIHGCWNLPSGYRFRHVHPDTKFVAPNKELQEITLCNSYNLVKAAVSLGQAIYAICTLYDTRGDQITRYGYAAFGLTVAPYALVSLVNLVANLICPDYSAHYVIETETLRKLRAIVKDQGKESEYPLSGSMGSEFTRIKPKSSQREGWQLVARCAQMAFAGLVFLTPLIIVAALTWFHKGHSTLPQRVWIMTWLVFGMFIGLFELEGLAGGAWSVNALETKDDDFNLKLGSVMLYSAPAIGGFVVVGQMLMNYGVCKQLM